MYIDFNNSNKNDSKNTPLEEQNQSSTDKLNIDNINHNCNNCIHKLLIPGGIYRCSIHNYLMMPNIIDTKFCNDVNISNNTRALIFGLFMYDYDNDKYIWTGIWNYVYDNKTDEEIKNILMNSFENDILPNNPQFNDIPVTCFLIAEGSTYNNMVNKTNFIEDNIVKQMITDIINKFSKQ